MAATCRGSGWTTPRRKRCRAAAAFAKRFKDQTLRPGSEAALRKMIEGLRLGKPDYDLMSPGLADVTRQQLPQLQSMIVELGALQSVTFKGVGPGGADIYQVKFENGSLEYRIWLARMAKSKAPTYAPANCFRGARTHCVQRSHSCERASYNLA